MSDDLAPAAGGTGVQLAKSASPNDDIFTNGGKAGDQETPATRAKKKLTRVPFTVSRLMEFCTRRELVNQTGHDVLEWPLVIVKELTDNAIDACEEAEIPPVISVAVKRGSIVIEDNGPGIPAKTIESVLDYSIRVSSREAYVSPTRGAQGNALKTILPMAYVLDERHGEEASGQTLIEAHGIAHHITFAVDHIQQEPKIVHTTKPSPVVCGTRVTVKLPTTLVWEGGYHEVDLVDYSKAQFLELAESYAWLNPHLSIRVSWEGEVKIDAKASNPSWEKWLPSFPTSAHWYDKSRFRRYMAAHIANRGNITIREFISEFRGLSSTAKQKAVLGQIGASHVSLHNFFGRARCNGDNVVGLLAALQEYSKPVRPAQLGVIGKEHFCRLMEAAGGDPKTLSTAA
jgi:DNA topoisomerase VI subunit B